MKSIYREYDIRGIFEEELNFDVTSKIGYYLGKKIKDIGGDSVAIGYDARTHSPILFKWLASGFNKAGVTVLNMGEVPTPTNYYANYCEFDGITPAGSVMITGSHNPKQYNGFKITIDKKPFFGKDIYSLGDEISSSTVQIKENDEHKNIDALDRYIAFLTEEFAHLKGMSQEIILDFGNGVGGLANVPVMKNLGLNFTSMFEEPDGNFPNHHPDPSDEKNLVKLKDVLMKTKDAIGFAYDGDSDRIAVLTKKHNIKGDILAILFAKKMESPVIVGEVKCSQIMYDEINKIGKAIMYKTGHSNLKVKLKEVDADLATEVSGHMFFNDRYFGYDDAIYATFRVLELIKNGMDLDAEVDSLPELISTEEIKVKTTEEKKFKIVEKLEELLKNPPSDFPKIVDIIDVDGVRVIFENGWGLVRASNTTPVLVTRFEAKEEAQAKLYEKSLNDLIKKADELV